MSSEAKEAFLRKHFARQRELTSKSRKAVADLGQLNIQTIMAASMLPPAADVHADEIKDVIGGVLNGTD